MGTSQATRRRAWRWLRFSLLTLCGVLLAGLFAGWLLLQTAWARELIRTRTNAALASLFQGKIEIERIGQVGLWGFGGVDARIFDPQGREVIRAQGLSARTSLPSMLLEIIGGSPLTLSNLRSAMRPLGCGTLQRHGQGRVDRLHLLATRAGQRGNT